MPPFVEDQAVEIVGEIGQYQFGFGARQANGANEQSEPALPLGEDMLDPSADAWLFRIGPSCCVRHGFAFAFAPVNVAGQYVFGQPLLIALRSIGAVSPYITSHIVSVDHMAQWAAIRIGSRGHCGLTNKAEPPIDRDVRLVTECWNGNHRQCCTARAIPNLAPNLQSPSASTSFCAALWGSSGQISCADLLP